MVADISGVAYFAPILSFLLVFIVVFAVLFKSKLLGEEKFIQIFTSLIIAALFVSVASVKQYVVALSAWFGVLAVSLFFLLFLLNFIGKWTDEKWIGVVFVILFFLVFIVAFLKVFGGVVGPYLPGSMAAVDRAPGTMAFFDWLYSPPVIGAALIILVSAVVSWALTRK